MEQGEEKKIRSKAWNSIAICGGPNERAWARRLMNKLVRSFQKKRIRKELEQTNNES